MLKLLQSRDGDVLQVITVDYIDDFDVTVADSAVDKSYGFIMSLDLIAAKISVFKSNWSIILPLMDIPLNLKYSGIKVWFTVDDSYYSEFMARKLIMEMPLNLIILNLNPILQVLLLNTNDVITDLDLGPLERQLRDLYRFHQYIIEPLNPSVENLDLIVYETFEKDKFKYDQYEEAISLAITDLKTTIKEPKILVVGAGKGGLVHRAFKHCHDITIVEKNLKVTPHLYDQNQTHWQGKVKIHVGDVRKFDCKPYDLVISEMIGSFGCNEMFPEIIRLHNKIVIPSQVQSMISLINNALEYDKPYLNNIKMYYAVAESAKLWEFNYPGDNDTDKHVELNMEVQVSGTVNSVMGVFESDLYGGISITNVKSRNYCKSWFPIIFPIEPFDVKKGDDVRVEFWRFSGLTYRWKINDKEYEYKVN